MTTMSETAPKPIDKPVATVQTRHRQGFQFPLPAGEIDKYMATRAGKMMVRRAVDDEIQEFLASAANKALKDVGGVNGLMAKVLGA